MAIAVRLPMPWTEIPDQDVDEIFVAVKRGGNIGQFGDPSGFQSGDVLGNGFTQSLFADMFETDLPAGDVLFDLLDKGQQISELGQPVVRSDKRFVEICGAGGDESCVDCVAFGAP